MVTDRVAIPRRKSSTVQVNRGYLLFEVNTETMSSNVLKISGNSRGRSTSEIADIFNT